VDKNNVDVTANPPVKTAYSFTNREWDQDAGMYYYRARYYDPGIGRFINEDPFRGILLDPKTIVNLYIYVLNRPGLLTDPSGRFPPDTHGSYCGNNDNKRGGDKRVDAYGNESETVDSLDEACKVHDSTYGPNWQSWLEFGNPKQTVAQFRSDLTLTKRSADHFFTSLARGDIEGVISGAWHTFWGATFSAWSGIRTLAAVTVDVNKKIFGDIFKSIGIIL
jgi:RHS repeat-associated protein